jgi:hypothetical protein
MRAFAAVKQSCSIEAEDGARTFCETPVRMLSPASSHPWSSQLQRRGASFVCAEKDKQMNDHEFISAIRVAVRSSSVKGIMQTLSSPPGRKPSSERHRLANWFNALADGEKENIRLVVTDAVDAALFGFLCVLDGVRSVEDGEFKGSFELWYVGDDERTLINDRSYLHDVYRSSESDDVGSGR